MGLLAHIQSRSVRASVLVVVLFAGGAAIAGLPATAQDADQGYEPVSEPESGVATDGAPATLAELMPESSVLHPNVLAYAPFAAAEVQSLTAELRSAVARQQQAVSDRQAAEVERLVLAEDLATNRAGLRRWDRIEQEREVLVGEAQDRLRTLAIGSFVSGDAVDLELEAILGHEDPMLTLNMAAQDQLVLDVQLAESRLDEARSTSEALENDRAALEATMPAIDERWTDAGNREVAAGADMDRLRPALEDATVLSRVSGVGFPAVVLDAYYRAALATNERYPSCNIGWNQLAGIGQVESHHGTYGGSSVQATGAVEPHILGIVLDGSRSLAISDTDGGVMDGNTVWDRAVGPMQFIPGSWAIFGSDGNGDGIKDPHNLYDAAAAAGDHLCRSHSGLDNTASFRTALFGYNRSGEYGTKVMAYAKAYGAAISLDRPPMIEGEGSDDTGDTGDDGADGTGTGEDPVVVAYRDEASVTQVSAQE